MPEILDDVAYLSREIGPRPAGTEEEQQAALYITEKFQKGAGLSATIEDFKCVPNDDVIRVICFGVSFVATILSFFVAALAIPAMILTTLVAVAYSLELVGRPVLSRLLSRGISQNVVAKYEPGYSTNGASARRRKIIVVSHYDSGKALAETKVPLLTALPVLSWASVGALILVPLVLIVRNTFFLHAVDLVPLIFNVITIILLIAITFPLISTIFHKIAAYNEAANCNASGVAVLMEVARRVGNGRVSAAELAEREAMIHGEEAARLEGLVPEGAQLRYEATQVKGPDAVPQTEAARLAAAKAAVAALTGKPVRETPADIAAKLVQVKEPPIPKASAEALRERTDETLDAFRGQTPQGNTADEDFMGNMQAGQDDFVASPPVASASVVPNTSSVPDWYKKAQARAGVKKETTTSKPQRSRYADALNAAEADMQTKSNQAEDSVISSETEERLRAVRDGIMEVGAPQNTSEFLEAPVPLQNQENVSEAELGSTMAMKPIDVGSIRQQVEEEPVNHRVSESRFADQLPPAFQIEPFAAPEMKPTPDVPSFIAATSPEDIQSSVPVSDQATQIIDTRQLAEQLNNASAQKNVKAPIVLPDISASTTSLPPVSELMKQRAPLAEAETSGKSAAKSLLSSRIPEVSLPSIEPMESPAATPKISPADLPSLSGVLRAQTEESQPSGFESNTVSATGSFAAIGATGSFAPVGNELVADIALEDRYIEDADDSAYDENFTETGAFAGPGYVEMPKSRTHKFFDKFHFRKKKKETESSPQEWLDVDDSFDARSAGAARGGWESFQEEPVAAHPVEFEETFEDDFIQNREVISNQSSRMDTFDPASFDEGSTGFFDKVVIDHSGDQYIEDDEDQKWHGGGFSRDHANQLEVDEFNPDVSAVNHSVGREASIEEEFKQIYQFKHPDIDTEVWFVALGSELSGNRGIKAFLEEHEQDLKGAVFVNLEALGAGSLSYIEREGLYRRSAASSRMKRYIKKASQASGVSTSTARIGWKESSSSVVLKHGAQAMSLVGMEGAKPAFYAQADDVLENISEEVLQQNSDFVMELLKNI